MTGSATFQELDVLGNLLATQTVPVCNQVTFVDIGNGQIVTVVPPGPHNPSTGLSAPFQPSTVWIAFSSGGLVVSLGHDPRGGAGGIPILGSTRILVAPLDQAGNPIGLQSGQKLAVW